MDTFTGTAPKNLGDPLDPKLDENTVRENYRNNPRIIKIKESVKENPYQNPKKTK